ncbi:UDP-N-acetylmuramoyl-L-alanyl-D-glutamate synthetase [Alkalihalobacillus alcalophilus ATCC 27647 = CGMCC 1.3604]|uniref:UDP-N-acetylmuramoylalanine--D-glutamate ligase n=1 Tax=Alkalihalobacillus alcalophilus ATCC 27647 = CGMCC 1.3604 TaxID=1218173 RepID=A0A094WM22_ALKAL|nr:UDP-N-acetylmuramoyl-L-alanine--D-glutamate ligase [Alkalihalobacillus alcalophilus]KGA97013.1 UDP-N-acetylmuramoyl-L-alanyl-D-glutamate synthetase [Alkalihalobacillus alcalophilus ATCC 27647 = CGMCC 1.3604]MED1563110.1 UDP-N-acetylmuramoyl-L-alanine--D-glutamate ligase [Alkalihalobacillus alcalophilus]THG90490.1 UDP-N-acetylmuramoyl-L-alanyl-D-glutamate synthetase [Alkalihalobacillus alcalophilus ATCC 27647 = CGMCC 1.3604]
MRAIQELAGKQVLVLGLAKSGEAAARLLHQLGVKVTINDAKPYKENLQAQQLEQAGFRVVCGEHPLSLLDEPFEFIVKNPGIPYTNPLVKEAKRRHLPVITEIELAYQISEADIVAITGSNGKTTTTTLIYEMLQKSSKQPLIAGNIGTVACEVAAKATKNNVIVMEVSSFQLMGTLTFQPKVSVLLNLFDAHLDYHGTKEEYIKAKANIVAKQAESDYFIYNLDDPLVCEVATLTKATKVPFTQKSLLEKGLSVFEGNLYFNGEMIIPVNEIVLPGAHNLENILAAVGAAILSGASIVQVKHVLKTFSGVEHRLQFVEQIDHRLFYNDSKATNILATKKALEAFDKPVILLAGGLDRGNEFDELIPALKNVSKLITFGQTAPKLERIAREANVGEVILAEKVEDAVQKAWQHSVEGEVILLSPACASWDQYKTFEVRGKEFINAVARIKENN